MAAYGQNSESSSELWRPSSPFSAQSPKTWIRAPMQVAQLSTSCFHIAVLLPNWFVCFERERVTGGSPGTVPPLSNTDSGSSDRAEAGPVRQVGAQIGHVVLIENGS